MRGAHWHTIMSPTTNAVESRRARQGDMPLDKTDTALRYRVADAGEDLIRLYYHNVSTNRDVIKESQS